MKAERIGSIEYYIVGDGSRAMLSMGKIHGNEPYSDKGLRKALEVIDKRRGMISYIAVPEANPSDTREYEGVDINRDFGNFWSTKTRDLRSLIELYRPLTIVDHHESTEMSDGFHVILSNSESKDSMEFRLATRVVERICYEEKLFEPRSRSLITSLVDLSVGHKLKNGIYYLGLGSTLTGYYKKGMVIEVPSKGVDTKDIEYAHKECDLFLKEELEILARENRI